MLNRKRNGRTRLYTEKAWKVKEVFYKIILVLLFPIWLPLYTIVLVSGYIEDALDFGDSLIRLFLDKVMPAFNQQHQKRGKKRG